MNNIDITKEDIRICDELTVENGHINAIYELWFDVEKYFNVKLSDSEWFNVYTNWYPNGKLDIIVHIDSDDGVKDLPWHLSDEETNFFINKMEDACKEQCGMTLSDLYKTYEM